jgi:hypothetical protein
VVAVVSATCGYLRGMLSGRAALAGLAGLVILGLSGCSAAHQDAVLSTVDRFYAALGSGDGATACALLAPDTRSELEQSSKRPCDRVILEEGVPHPGVRRGLEVFGTMAQARFTRDTVFLARFGDRWRVMATACKPVPDEPYSCSVKGG